MEARKSIRAACEFFGQELQRHRLAELQILGPVHLTHATATDEADDALTIGQHRAGDEARVFDGIGRRRARRSGWCRDRWAVSDADCGGALRAETARGRDFPLA